MMDDAAESGISLTLEQWNLIQNGGEHVEKSEVCYDGNSECVTWLFKDGLVTIDGEEGGQWLVNSPISELFVEE
jgi:hypothetical protein